MPMPENIEIGYTAFVPVGDSFLNGYGEPADAPFVNERIAVVQAEGFTVNFKVSVVRLADDPCHFIGDFLLQNFIQQPFVGIFPTRAVARLNRRAPVVANGTGNNDLVEITLFTKGVDELGDPLLQPHNCLSRSEFVLLAEFLVNESGH